jgi:hypothetical protein
LVNPHSEITIPKSSFPNPKPMRFDLPIQQKQPDWFAATDYQHMTQGPDQELVDSNKYKH